MSPPLDARELLAESLPVVAVLGLWVVVSWLAPRELVATGLRTAGIVMAVLYVGVRGVHLARSRPPASLPTDVSDLLVTNLRVLGPAAVWFLGAAVVAAAEPYWDMAGLPGLFTSPVESITFVLTGTGVATVLLAAVVIGVGSVGEDRTAPGPSTAAAPGDD